VSEPRYAIWGSAGHAKVLGSLIALRGGRVIALFDNSDVPPALPGVPVFLGEAGFRSWVEATPAIEEVTGFVAIGGDRGRDRLKIQALFRAHGMHLTSLVHPDASVCSTARLGAGTQVLAQAIVAADARLGEACIVNHRGSVDHECVLGDGIHLGPAATLCGCVTLHDNVMVGAAAVVLPRITIGANSVIGAGAVITRDVPPDCVVFGNPGRCR
jgi:sugar O-acyltransferase (sialic acid O-acetyltransferase NeuD family)